MKEYTPNKPAVCIKCGCNEVPRTFYDIAHDEIQRACNRCGYYYRETPLDRKYKYTI